jgi:hypothetical protein
MKTGANRSEVYLMLACLVVLVLALAATPPYAAVW